MSIIKQKKQRVAIFIDAQNLYHSAKSAYGANVNFKNILDDTLADRELVRAIAYVITTESREEKSFFEALTKSGIETKSKELQIFFGGAKKGDWDVGIAVDAIRLAPKVDAIIIVSGDGDFIPLVEYLKFSFGCQVEAATFGASASAGLLDVVDDFFDLSEDLDRYLMKSYQRGFKNKFFPKHKANHNFKNNKDFLDKNNNEGLEVESPEMVAERLSSQRGKLIKSKKSEHPFRQQKKATEVEILRVKNEDFVKVEKNKTDKSKTELQKTKKIVRATKTKKITSIKKKNKVVKKIREASKKAIIKKK